MVVGNWFAYLALFGWPLVMREVITNMSLPLLFVRIVQLSGSRRGWGTAPDW